MQNRTRRLFKKLQNTSNEDFIQNLWFLLHRIQTDQQAQIALLDRALLCVEEGTPNVELSMHSYTPSANYTDWRVLLDVPPDAQPPKNTGILVFRLLSKTYAKVNADDVLRVHLLRAGEYYSKTLCRTSSDAFANIVRYLDILRVSGDAGVIVVLHIPTDQPSNLLHNGDE